MSGDVRRPRLLDDQLHVRSVIDVENVAITLNSPGVSQATLTLTANEPEPPLHSWIEIFNQNGSVGIFRVSVPSQDYVRQQSIVLRHGIDSLADSHLEFQGDFSGTAAQFLSRLLSAQTTRVNGQAPWTLGQCDDTGQVNYSINYDRLSDLLAKLEEDHDDYYFSYDQSTFPWKVNFLQKPAQPDSEFRLSRNVRTISRTLNDNDLCTQLILSVNVETVSTTESGSATSTDTVIRKYDNAEAQALWGVIQRTADIDTHDNISGGSFSQADAWAQRFLRDHAGPTVQIQIDGDELFRLTGDTWDEFRLAHLCLVSLPQYQQAFSQRVVAVSYPQALSDPTHITVSLSTQLPKFSSSIASLQKASAANAAAARSISRSAAKAKEVTHWSMVVSDQQLALDGTGITELYESGIDMDAQGGVKIYSLMQGFQSLYSGITVNTEAIEAEVRRATAEEGTISGNLRIEAGKISQIVTAVGQDGEVTAGSIVLAINNAGSEVQLNADKIYLNGETIASIITAEKLRTDALYAGTAQVEGIYSKGGITALKFITAGTYINAGTDLQINGSSMKPAVATFGEATASGGKITIPTTTVVGTAGSSINFNIADTQYFKDSVAAAKAEGETAGYNRAAALRTTLYTDANGTFTAPFGYSQVTVDVPQGGGNVSADNIDIANGGDSGDIGGSYTDPGYTNLGSLSNALAQAPHNSYVWFRGTINPPGASVAGYKYYQIKVTWN